MNKLKFLFFLAFFFFNSCGPTIKILTGFHNPKVEDKKELAAYFSSLFPEEKTFFMKVNEIGNTREIWQNISLGFDSEVLLFNASGQKFCYTGTEECAGLQMNKAFTEFENYFKRCPEEMDATWDSILEKLIDSNGTSFSKDQLPKADYYLFQNWNKYMGSKKRLKEELNWVINLKKNAAINVAILFINGDMLEDWGLEKNKELPVKFHKKGGNYNMTFGQLPLQKGYHKQ